MDALTNAAYVNTYAAGANDRRDVGFTPAGSKNEVHDNPQTIESLKIASQRFLHKPNADLSREIAITEQVEYYL